MKFASKDRIPGSSDSPAANVSGGVASRAQSAQLRVEQAAAGPSRRNDLVCSRIVCRKGVAE